MPIDGQHSEFRTTPRPIVATMNVLARGLIALIKIPVHFLDHVTSHRKSQITSSAGLSDLNSNTPILIYVHYSKAGKLTDREIATLRQIRKVGFQICLVINIEHRELFTRLGAEILDNVEINCKILRKNIGWDLSAYRDAYFLLKSNGKVGNSPILFMNNSVIWFPEMIDNYFNSILCTKNDIIAGSISNQYRPHIQTFLFGSLNQEGTTEIERWLKKIKNWRLKRTVVSYGELATNKILKSSNPIQSFPDYGSLQESGLRTIQEDYESRTSLTPYVVVKRLLRNRALTQAGIPLNPSHDYWLEMIENGFPGIKVDLVRSNPSNLIDYEIVVSALLARGFNYKMINDLHNSNKPKSIVYKVRTFIKW